MRDVSGKSHVAASLNFSECTISEDLISLNVIIVLMIFTSSVKQCSLERMATE